MIWLKSICCWTLCLCLGLLATNAQEMAAPKVDKNYFSNPLTIPIQLSANFAELRKDHYHMGLDIRTNQRENLPVLAAAEGYISRIKIEQYGYGRAIYITHPNGYTTLYAHLNNFYDSLHKFVLDKQYATQQWAQDFTLAPHQFEVKKGQFIAYSGNTGGSQGPHLHFEIRDEQGNNQNPLLYNLGLKDDLVPLIYKLYWYNRQHSIYEATAEPIAITGGKGTYTSKDSVVQITDSLISFGIAAEDITNGSSFTFGIYRAEVWVDDTAVFAFELNNFSYDKSKYVNAGIDYPLKYNHNQYVQHLSKLPGNQLQIFDSSLTNGIIALKDTALHSIKILVKDVNNNTSTLSFTLKRNVDTLFQNNYVPTWQDALGIPNQKTELQKAGLQLRFPSNSFYDTVQLRCVVDSSTKLSNTYTICCASIPLHTDYQVQIKGKHIPAQLSSKVVATLTTPKGSYSNICVPNNDWYASSFDELGKLQLAIDTIGPSIQPIGWENNGTVNQAGTLVVKVTDNLSGIQQFNAFLDGQWLLFSRKDQYFLYDFDEHSSLGLHCLTIHATDDANNTTVEAFTFTQELPKPKPIKKVSTKKTKKKKTVSKQKTTNKKKKK